MKSFIEIKNVSFKYQESSLDYALKNINMSIKEGDFVAIVGHNGSGKSTLSKHLNAILTPTVGEILIDGINTKNIDKVYDIRSKIGLIFQNPDNQLVSSLVEDDVAFGPENLGIDSKNIKKRVDLALESVGMENYRKKFVYELSGGQKQRVAIAGILAMKPMCIVLDEATSMLDPKGKNDVLNILLKLNQNQKITIIMVTHFMEEAALSNNIFIMKDGKLVANGNKKQIFKDKKLLTSCGISLPIFSDLIFSLKESGANINEIPSNEEECIKILHSYLSHKNIV